MKKIMISLLSLLSLSAFAVHRGGVVKHLFADQVNLKIGQTYEVELESNPTTGYSWRGSCDTENVEMPEKGTYIKNQSSENMVGSGGKDVFTVTAKKPGKAICSFQYNRSWEKEPSGTEAMYEFTVTE